MKLQINHIDQFKSLLRNKKEIKLKKEMVDGKEVGIISYAIEKDDTFNTSISRECRGIVFDMKTGECICRPYHKFFNVNQKAETQIDKIDWNGISYIGTKHDGSLLMPVLINDKIFWKTKKSFYSEVAIKATKVWNEKYKGSVFEHNMTLDLKAGLTPLFEFVDKEVPIVIKNNESDFILLALRNIKTGEYKFFKHHEDLKQKFNSLADFVNEVKDKEDIEGYVISDGENIYKVKTQWYLERHRMLSKYTINSILDLYINDVIDDFIAELYTFNYVEKAKMIEKFRDEFTNWILNIEEVAQNKLEELKKKHKRTELRIQIAQMTNSALMFNLLDGKDVTMFLKKKMRDHFKDVYKNKIFFMGEEL